MAGETRLVLAGDVMTGRGVDQVLPHPGDPRLHERWVADARTYVHLAEQRNGAVPRPVDPRWPWGETLEVMDAFGPAVRVMNLETSVTTCDEVAEGKAVHYRMSPDNVACLTAAGADLWTLANNHLLDHGVAGLRETLEALRSAGLRYAGAGLDEAGAWEPAAVGPPGHRVVVCSVGHASSGVPSRWAAGPGRPGVAVLPDLSRATADALAARLRQAAGPGDLRVVSVHWGGNWGYDVPRDHRRFAHRLLDGGVHLVHGHSSHHPRPVEVHDGRAVLYGCGDLVNDYEGIDGFEEYRGELRLLYLARLDAGSGELVNLTMVPFQAHRLSLRRAARADAAWLAGVLTRAGGPLGTGVAVTEDGSLVLRAG